MCVWILILIVAISWVYNVTTGTFISFISRFMSVIANVVALFAAALEITQFVDQVKMRLISQLINDISIILQKLLKYFNGIVQLLTAI